MELPALDCFPQKHGDKSVMVNSGRCALEYILRSLMEVVVVARVYVPYYTCATVLEPLKRLGVSYSFYRVDERLEVDETCFPQVGEGEYLLYTNYFALKQPYVEKLSIRLGGRLIVDNCLALYAPPLPGVPSLYSPRKWSGLADGGVAVLDDPLWQVCERDESWRSSCYLLRCLERGVEDAAEDCERSEERLRNAPLMEMSSLTRQLIRGIDYKCAARERRENFRMVHERIGHLNRLEIDFDPDVVPFCYPLWTNLPQLRNYLIDHGILIPMLWPDLPSSLPEGCLETSLVSGLLPLPIDQRYSRKDMLDMLDVIASFYA